MSFESYTAWVHKHQLPTLLLSDSALVLFLEGAWKYVGGNNIFNTIVSLPR